MLCAVLFFMYVFTLHIILHIRWTIAGSTIIVILRQRVMLSERSPVLTKLTVTVPLSSLTLTGVVSNSIVATNGEM